MASSTARLHAVFPLLRDRVEGRYKIPVRIMDVPDPFAGDLDGAEIHLDYASADALQVYRGLETLTGAATTEEQARLDHRLLSFVDPRERIRFVRTQSGRCFGHSFS